MFISATHSKFVKKTTGKIKGNQYASGTLLSPGQVKQNTFVEPRRSPTIIYIKFPITAL